MSRRAELLRAVSIVVAPMRSPPGTSLPFIVLPSGVFCLAFHAFLQSAKSSGRSGSWRHSHAVAVALLYDFMLATVPTHVVEPTQAADLIANFAERLLYGTISLDGRDPSGLFWPAYSWPRAESLLLAVRTFCSFVSTWQPKDLEAGCAVRVQTLRHWHSSGRSSASSDGPRAQEEGAPGEQAPDLPFRAKLAEAQAGHGRPMPFPASLEMAFLSALMPTKGSSTKDRHIAIRNVLYFLLLLYGGLRKSEPLHLWLQDIHPDPAGQGAIVFLYHPETGGVPGQRTTRSEFLRKLGLVPRTRHHINQSRWSGWKSLLLDENAPERCMRSRVYWRNTQAGLLFWDLHKIYVSEVRPKNAAHPWYFTNLADSTYGDPLTIEAADGGFETALRRLGLSPDRYRGLAPHCTRHAYGQALSDARVRPEVLQICLHHRDPASQLVYTRPFPAAISDELTRAEERIRQGTGAPCFETLGVRFKSDPLGIFGRVAPLVSEAAVETIIQINRARSAR